MEEKTPTSKAEGRAIKYPKVKASSILLQSKTYLTNSSLSKTGSSKYTSAESAPN